MTGCDRSPQKTANLLTCTSSISECHARRSTFAGSGRWAAHWSGDNRADWVNLQWSVPALLQSNIWGMPLAGSDICGFSKQPSEELCARWISAGAFYTFSRTHKAYGGAGHEMYR
jgi:alpha-glucosidase (family GH31 glycosyl hydrolase)